ncbi:YcnI family copper-binding membrane protein [Herbiconiux sp. YIM B11900]|uniref:YcnI family copper-binding membrane protein n=1 Tax=Herbiconiux sp. YIM B11900 TaxID=3404131 RepID=UPI003F87A5AB
MTSRSFARATTIGAASLVVAGAVLFAAPLAASAHVHVEPGSAEPGSYSVLTFRVPNESASAVTTSVTVQLPADTPFSSVSYEPVPGWTAQVVTGALPSPVVVGDATLTEAPLTVVWTADAGSGIAAGQFQEFPIVAGPVPATGSIELPTSQGYSDGTVVDWDESTPASGEEPEHPAPTLYVQDAAPGDEHGGSGADAGVSATPAAGSSDGSASAAASGDTASAGLGFGIGGFALGAIALVVAVVALFRRPSAAVTGAGAGAGAAAGSGSGPAAGSGSATGSASADETSGGAA